MRPFFSLVLLFGFGLFGFAATATAQNERWEAYPALRNVQSVSASSDALWAGTDGGVFRYAPASGEIERFTPVEGLSRVDVQAITYDAARDVVWIGYADGVLDRLDAATGAVTPFFDIAQADRFTVRGINRIDIAADSLLISTGFGVVVFDVAGGEVSDTYERFGSFEGSAPVGDVLVAPLPDGRPGLWVGTAEGIAYAPLNTANFREPSAWTVDSQAPEDVLSLAFFDGRLYAGTSQIGNDEDGRAGGYRRGDDGSWERVLTERESFPDLLVTDEGLVAVTFFRIALITPTGEIRRYNIDDVLFFRSGTVGPDGNVWVGADVFGLNGFPSLAEAAPGTVSGERRVIPDGPTSNAILSLDIAPNGDVWTGFRSASSEVNGFARFDGTMWTNFSVGNGALPRGGSVFDVHADDAGNIWFGLEGAGVYQYTDEGEIVLYNDENSTIREVQPDFFVTVGLDTDEEGRLWVTNRFTAPPLHVRATDGAWSGVDRPNTISSTVNYDKIYIDSFGQKWITGYQGDGFLVIDTGDDPADASDDRAVAVSNVGSVGTGLPDEEVNAIIEDRSGRIWLGTDRGLATVFSPGSIFSGDPEQQVTWARTPDGADFFLRDLRIFDIAVDPADRKWLASNSGVWLLNDEGNEVIANFTTENSPLPSDVVVAVDVDERDGTVYFATSGGLYTYRGDAVAAMPEAGDLFIYPNPVRAEGGPLPEIAITGLVDDADVRVLTVDGQLVASFRTRGGSMRWDGRDRRTGGFVPSGVYIVAAAGQDGEGTAYGKIAVIR